MGRKFNKAFKLALELPLPTEDFTPEFNVIPEAYGMYSVYVFHNNKWQLYSNLDLIGEKVLVHAWTDSSFPVCSSIDEFMKLFEEQFGNCFCVRPEQRLNVFSALN